MHFMTLPEKKNFWIPLFLQTNTESLKQFRLKKFVNKLYRHLTHFS